MLNLWAACRQTMGMFGRITALPCAGGVGDQPAALMDAFTVLDAAAKGVE